LPGQGVPRWCVRSCGLSRTTVYWLLS
jgi:hypothetical protein